MVLSFTPGVSSVVGTASQLSGALSDPATSTQISGQMTASQGGNALSSVGLNQYPVGTAAGIYALTHTSERLIAYATSLSIAASGDVALTMSNNANLGQYIVRRVTWGLPLTAALATVIAVALVRTASGGLGSALTGALVVTGLAATNAFLDQVVSLASQTVTATQLYVNITTAASTAPSSQLFVWGQTLGV